jgi:hypothetical protein
MGAVLDLAEASWAGTSTSHPFEPLAVLEEVADGVAFFSGFANVAVVRAGGQLVLIDTGNWLLAPTLHKAVGLVPPPRSREARSSARVAGSAGPPTSS